MSGGWVEERIRGDARLFVRHARWVRLRGRARTLPVARGDLLRVCLHDMLLVVAVRERDGRVVRRLEVLHERVDEIGRVCG